MLLLLLGVVVPSLSNSLEGTKDRSRSIGGDGGWRWNWVVVVGYGGNGGGEMMGLSNDGDSVDDCYSSVDGRR